MTLDYSTINFCDTLLNATYGVMLMIVWSRKREVHYLLWALSLLLLATVTICFAFAHSGLAVAILFGAVAANVTLVWAGMRAFEGVSLLEPRMMLLPGLVFVEFLAASFLGERGIGRSGATLLLAVNVLTVGRYVLGRGNAGGELGKVIVAWALLAYMPIYVASAALSIFGAETTISTMTILISDLVLNNVFVAGLFVMVEDRSRNQLRELATRDELTGALNRGGLFTRIGSSCREGHLAFLLADLDHFKSINDTFGHAAGDAVLRTFVSRTAACLEPGEFIGRLGGEEFGIVLPNSGWDAASARAEAIREAMGNLSVICGLHAIEATVSLGVAVSLDGEPLEATIGRSDEALYRAKRNGRNRIAA